MDRDSKHTGKERGGGVCLYVSEKFCDRANVTVKQRTCTPELELISVSLRPRYLPREFERIFVTVVYAAVYDSTSAARAGKAIAAAVRDLQLISADAPCFVVGDFNHCDLRKALPSFRQFVTCPTREKNTTDLCYGNVPRSYKSVSIPPVGKSDHNAIHLIPAFRPKIQTDPIVKKSVKVWTTESEDELRGCYECTDWNVLTDSCANVNEAADVVCDYFRFCEDMIIPTKTIKVFTNNKPWITKSIKTLLNEKKFAFQKGDKEHRKQIQTRLRTELRKGQRIFKEKIEKQFGTGRRKDAWEGLKTLTGETKRNSDNYQMNVDEQRKFANDLNRFYCRFERDDLDGEVNRVLSQLEEGVRAGKSEDFQIDAKTVESVFKGINSAKAIGPDNISGRLLKTCASELCDIYCRFFNWSLNEFVCWLVGCLTSRNRLVYLRDGSAQTILRATTLRQKLHIKRSTSPSHSILTPG